MARYIGPKSRISRRFGEAIFGPDKVLSKRNYPAGQHGNNRRKKSSEYGLMLAEKQKAKYTYGVLERQFRNLFEKAASTDGVTGEVLLQSLEACLDNVVYRLGIAPTRYCCGNFCGFTFLPYQHHKQPHRFFKRQGFHFIAGFKKPALKRF